MMIKVDFTFIYFIHKLCQIKVNNLAHVGGVNHSPVTENTHLICNTSNILNQCNIEIPISLRIVP